jgi:hypothetical protein
MGCFRILVALVLLVLAVGFGLCGLFLTGFGNASDKTIGMILMLLAVGALIGGWALFSGSPSQPAPHDRSRRE